MFVKTEFCDNLKRARITIRSTLKPKYYYYDTEVLDTSDAAIPFKKLKLGLVSKELREVELTINFDSTLVISLHSSTSIWDDKEWLVIELVEAGKLYSTPESWEKFLATTTAKILSVLTAKSCERVATIEYDCHKRFIVLDDNTNGYDDEDYINI